MQFSFGSIIKENRTRLKISQAELSDGLCAISTLSKIECGLQEPHLSLAGALLSRLGLSLTNYNISKSCSDNYKYKLEYLIKEKIFNHDFNLKELLDDYHNYIDNKNKLDIQFYKYAKLISNFNDLTVSEREEELLKIIRLTIERYDFSYNLDNIFLSNIEMKILNSLYVNHYNLNKEESLQLLSKLITYIEMKKYNENENIDIYMLVIYNTALFEAINGKYQEAILNSKKIIDLKKQQVNRLFPLILYIDGFSKVKLNKIDEGIKLLRDSLVFFKYLNEDSTLKHKIEDIKKNLGSDILNKVTQTSHLPDEC